MSNGSLPRPTYGAWYISQLFDILVSNPEVFSKTVFLINYDEADGSFDHIVPPSPPPTPSAGASTVSIENEIVTTSIPNGPIGLAQRVPFIAVSPWSKGGYVNSQVFDHTSTIQFIEKRFGVFEKNLSPWRRAVAGELTSVFNSANPNNHHVSLPGTNGYLPSVPEMGGGNIDAFQPTLNDVIIGVPSQEKGIRPARALPYELDVHGSVHAPNSTVGLKYFNTGKSTVVFGVRSENSADAVRFYTVEPGKTLADTWSAAPTYNLSVYGPNGFARYFQGSVGTGTAILDVRSAMAEKTAVPPNGRLPMSRSKNAEVIILNAYTGESSVQLLQRHDDFEGELSLSRFHGWYDLIITAAGDPTFKYQLAGHVETGTDSFSDPALSGVITLKC